MENKLEFKGTKGPWVFMEDSGDSESGQMGYYIIADEKSGWGKWIGEAKFPNLYKGTSEESLNNARLIAAAPELLKELINMVQCWDNDTFQDIDIDCAKKAINKALGQ